MFIDLSQGYWDSSKNHNLEIGRKSVEFLVTVLTSAVRTNTSGPEKIFTTRPRSQ